MKRDDSVLIDLNQSVNLFEIFKDSSILTFKELPDGSIPGFVTKLIAMNDTLFVLDGYKSKAFYAFDSKGQPLFVYNNMGNGGDEYLFLGDFDLDDHFIYLMDNDSHKVLVLGKDGKFKKADPIPMHVSHIKVCKNFERDLTSCFFDMYNMEEARLIYRNGNKKADTLMLTPDQMTNFNYSPQKVFYCDTNSNELLYMPSYSSIIYKLDGSNEPIEYLSVDFNGLMPDTELFETLKGRKSSDKFSMIKEGFAYYFSFNSNSTHVLIGFVYDNKTYLCFIDKNSHTTEIFNLASNYSILELTNDKLYLRTNDSDNLTVVNISTLNNKQ